MLHDSSDRSYFDSWEFGPSFMSLALADSQDSHDSPKPEAPASGRTRTAVTGRSLQWPGPDSCEAVRAMFLARALLDTDNALDENYAGSSLLPYSLRTFAGTVLTVPLQLGSMVFVPCLSGCALDSVV